LTRQIPWLRVFVEGVVIVGSILLAFGLQAWWEGKQEREEERESLDALAHDFEAATDAIEEQLLVMDSILVAADIVLEWTGPNADSRHADSLAVLVQVIGRLPSFQPPMGTLEALLGSGDLRLIQNDTLRAALASFPSRLARVSLTESYGVEQMFGQLRPFLNESIPMRLFGLGGDGVSRFESDVGGLLRSMAFENRVQGRVTNVRFLRGSGTDMHAFISSLRTMLEEERSR